MEFPIPSVINHARIYVSVNRVFWHRENYAGVGKYEAPLDHQKTVVAYPQNTYAALRSSVNLGELEDTITVPRAQPTDITHVRQLTMTHCGVVCQAYTPDSTPDCPRTPGPPAGAHTRAPTMLMPAPA